MTPDPSPLSTSGNGAGARPVRAAAAAAATAGSPSGEPIETDVPNRMDRLPWSSWHWLVVTALAVTWALDGLEVTLVNAMGGVLQDPKTLGMTPLQYGATGTTYLVGAVVGALVFGYLTDRMGRKKLFYITLAVYLVATALTAFSWNFASFAFFRALTGAGIGGEYAAINSAVDELIPARVRGRVDLAINSIFWAGATLGALGTLFLLNPALVPVRYGWRFAFGIGAVLGLIIIYFRHWVPESPRWLMTHGKSEEASRIVSEIEQKVSGGHPDRLPAPEGNKSRFHVRMSTPWREIWDAVVHKHRNHSLLGLSLMIAQAFFYNAILFTYGTVLTHFFNVSESSISLYILPITLGNMLGPIVLGHLFDTVGRKPMITITYSLSGILLAVTAWMFQQGMLSATTQMIAWVIIFFIASSSASAAYLTVSEIFPLEVRAMAISLAYAAGTLVGGAGGPILFGYLIKMNSPAALAGGYLFAAVLMVLAGVVEVFLGVKAEGQALENITAPLSAAKN